MPPITWVKLSGDAMAAAMFHAHARSDADVASFTLGMLDAISGRPKPEAVMGRLGWEFGIGLANEAAAHQTQITEARRGAAQARWGKHRPAMQPDAIALQPHASAMQSDAQYNTRQDNTIHGGGGVPRSTGKVEAAAAAADEEDLFPGNEQEGPFLAELPPTPSQPRPARDPASLGMKLAATAQARDASLADMRVLHPALLIMAEDRQAAEVSLRLYGGDAWRSVLTRLCVEAKARPKGKHRVMFNDLQDALAKTTKLSIEDFHRAGIDAPAWAVPQATLDAMPTQEFQRYGTP